MRRRREYDAPKNYVNASCVGATWLPEEKRENVCTSRVKKKFFEMYHEYTMICNADDQGNEESPKCEYEG